MRSDPPPRIGLSTYREPAAWGVWHEPADLLPARYADAVVAAGGAPLLLPPPSPAVGDAGLDLLARAVLDGVDGLVIAGGADLDPGRYGEPRDPATGGPRPDRDAWELALAATALRAGMPLLGVCRGMQVLAVALGGVLVQHLPDVVGHDGHCPTEGAHARHPVWLTAGSRLAAILGPCAEVATYHHQAVATLPARTAHGPAVVTARAQDGTVEALELTGPAWVVGVQWHPEVHDGQALFEEFAVQCAGRVRVAGRSRS